MNRRSFLKAVVAVAAFPSAVLSRVRAPVLPLVDMTASAYFMDRRTHQLVVEEIIRDDYARAFAEAEDRKFLT